MKAWIKPVHSVTKKQKQAVKEYVKEELRSQQIDVTRRVFKLFCASLNKKYGFGKGRLSVVLGDVNALCEEKKNDPVFWAHIDKLVIEQIGLDFIREDYEAMGE
jgi:hypothetical protein